MKQAVSINMQQPKVEMAKKQRPFFGMLKRLCRNPLAVSGLVIILTLIILSILAPVIAPYPYEEMDAVNKFQPPSLEHLMGTDDYGRDIFSRILWGGRYTLTLGILAALLSTAIGVVLGAVAGYFGGWIDNVILRAMDVIQSIPAILLNIILSAVLGPGLGNTIIAMAATRIAGQARMMRANILTIREQEYLEASSAINCSKLRIILKHTIPNAISPLIVSTTMGIGGIINSAAGLSFLGLGVQPPTPEWGAMLSGARSYLRYYPHMLIFPGIMIGITVLSVNLFGDGLRDALDPKLKD